jgi:hypothetical protein
MRYDPTWQALLHPERGAPLLGSSVTWNPDALCAELARLAYIRFEGGQAKRLQQALASEGFAAPAEFHEAGRDAQGFGTSGPDGTSYLAYRGTEPGKLRDIATDARFRPVRWVDGGWVHAGFAAAEAALWPRVGEWVAGLGSAPLVITGHSLGAAMATLTAARLRNARLVTFGSPRVGNGAFAALFAGRDARRYVDCGDLVEDLRAPLGYRHLAGERYIDRRGVVRPSPPGWLERTRDQLAADADFVLRCAGRPGNVPLRELADHAPINYVSAVLGVREGP